MAWDGFVAVRGNRYSVPAACCGQTVTVHISLNGALAIYQGERCIARHSLCSAQAGWQRVPEHHQRLWADLAVQRRDLATYEPYAHSEVCHAAG